MGKRKKFKWILKEGMRYSNSQLIGLAKAMSKTDARIVSWKEVFPNAYIIFSVKELYSIFKEQLESYLIVVEELNTDGGKFFSSQP